MYPNHAVSYELAQARIADLRHQARREDLARAARLAPRPGRPRIPASLRFRPARRHRAAAAAG
jgi:hypothetical protein